MSSPLSLERSTSIQNCKGAESMFVHDADAASQRYWCTVERINKQRCGDSLKATTAIFIPLERNPDDS